LLWRGSLASTRSSLKIGALMMIGVEIGELYESGTESRKLRTLRA